MEVYIWSHNYRISSLNEPTYLTDGSLRYDFKNIWIRILKNRIHRKVYHLSGPTFSFTCSILLTVMSFIRKVQIVTWSREKFLLYFTYCYLDHKPHLIIFMLFLEPTKVIAAYMAVWPLCRFKSSPLGMQWDNKEVLILTSSHTKQSFQIIILKINLTIYPKWKSN